MSNFAHNAIVMVILFLAFKAGQNWSRWMDQLREKKRVKQIESKLPRAVKR